MTLQPEFTFPLLCFTSDQFVSRIADAYELGLGGRRAVVDDEQLGMEMIELSGRSWRVTAVRYVGKVPYKRGYGSFFGGPLRLVERTYEAGPTLSVDQVRDRVLAHVDKYPEIFCHFPDDPEELEAVKVKMRALSSIAAFYDQLRPEGFTF